MPAQTTPLEERVNPIHRVVGELLGALREVREAPAWAMTPAEKAETLRELAVVEAQVAEVEMRTLAAADCDEIGAQTGAANTAVWLAVETRQTRTASHARLRLARALDLEVFTVTRQALAAGRLHVEQARVIVAAVEDLPSEEVSDGDRVKAQRHLIGLAAEHDAKTLRLLARRLWEVLAPEEAERREGEKLEAEERRARERCRFGIRDNGDGTMSGTFRLPSVQGQMLAKAVQALAAPRRTDPNAWIGPDGRRVRYAVLLGQAFCELVEHLPVDKLPQAGGLAASVIVTMDFDKLRAGVGAGCLDTGAEISAGQVRRLACGAGILPAVLDGTSQPLDLGRKDRLFNSAQRAAMAVRDGGCTAEGCDRPPAWCEAHHDHPWSQGGKTDLADGRLLCPHHHHLAHDDRFDKRVLPDNQIRFHRRT